MSNFFDETMQGLLEAAEIAKGNIPLTEREDMPAPTFYVADDDNSPGIGGTTCQKGSGQRIKSRVVSRVRETALLISYDLKI